MAVKIVILSVIMTTFSMGGGRPDCFAQTGNAFDRLLLILESKGVLSNAEMAAIQTLLEEDRERLQQKEEALDQREKDLDRRERILSLSKDRSADERRSQPAPAVHAEKTAAPHATEALPETRTAEADADVGRSGTAAGQDLCLTLDGAQRLSFCPGVLLQTDYRYFDFENGDPNDNGFDIRRARLLLGGDLLEHFAYGFQYEFQGAGSRNLLDALVDVKAFDFMTLRMGQFKEPFGLEQYTSDKNLFFTERAMGYALTPSRDVGAMVHATVLDGRLTYGLGIFNGDGLDDATGGDADSPQLTGRLVVAPLKNTGWQAGEDLQFGASLSYADIGRNNVVIEADTAGGTRFLDVSPNAKFAIVQNADQLVRYGAELGWSIGPVALMGEYIAADFQGIETSSNSFDLNLHAYYGAMLWMLTGEHPRFQNGVLQPIVPAASLWQNGWGALGLALRYDYFQAGSEVYDYLVSAGDSVREATAYNFALNWYLNRFARVSVEFTRTEFDQPLIIDRDPQTGDAVFSDYEHVFKARFQFAF
jgi:phosphate-selective porin OprO/OprP